MVISHFGPYKKMSVSSRAPTPEEIATIHAFYEAMYKKKEEQTEMKNQIKTLEKRCKELEIENAKLTAQLITCRGIISLHNGKSVMKGSCVSRRVVKKNLQECVTSIVQGFYPVIRYGDTDGITLMTRNFVDREIEPFSVPSTCTYFDSEGRPTTVTHFPTKPIINSLPPSKHLTMVESAQEKEPLETQEKKDEKWRKDFTTWTTANSQKKVSLDPPVDIDNTVSIAYGVILPKEIETDPLCNIWQASKIVVDLGMGLGHALLQMFLMSAEPQQKFYGYELVPQRFAQAQDWFKKLIVQPDSCSSLESMTCTKKIGTTIKLFLKNGLECHVHADADFFLFDIKILPEAEKAWINFFKTTKPGCKVLSFQVLPFIFPSHAWISRNISIDTSWGLHPFVLYQKV